MGYVIRMPQMGMTMDEGTVVEWRVGEGESVEEGEVFVLVESEKSTMDVQARESGKIARTLVQEGTTVEPGDPIGILTAPGEDASAFDVDVEDDTSDAPVPAEGRSPREDTERVRATPGARKLAEERHIDLGTVDGTGPQGVITESDIPDEPEPDPGASQTVRNRYPLSETQQTIARRLGESQDASVPVTLDRTFDASPLQEICGAARGQDIDVSITDLLIKATGVALRDHPRFNATFEDGHVREVEEVNINVAIDVDRGLVTPVIPDVAYRSAESVSVHRRRITERVVADEFTMDVLAGGTFTISNLGMFGIDRFTPVINPPQVGILGVGRIRDDDTITLSLTFDHRVVNGADAARFLDAIVNAATDRETLCDFFDSDLQIQAGRTTETRDITVASTSGYSGMYRAAGTEVRFDEPTDMGGTGHAPTPVEHLLGALGSCLALSVRAMAERDAVALDAIEADVDGSPAHGPLESIEVQLRLESGAAEADLDRVVTKAERACYVDRALDDDLEITVTWDR